MPSTPAAAGSFMPPKSSILPGAPQLPTTFPQASPAPPFACSGPRLGDVLSAKPPARLLTHHSSSATPELMSPQPPASRALGSQPRAPPLTPHQAPPTEPPRVLTPTSMQSRPLGALPHPSCPASADVTDPDQPAACMQLPGISVLARQGQSGAPPVLTITPPMGYIPSTTAGLRATGPMTSAASVGRLGAHAPGFIAGTAGLQTPGTGAAAPAAAGRLGSEAAGFIPSTTTGLRAAPKMQPPLPGHRSRVQPPQGSRQQGQTPLQADGRFSEHAGLQTRAAALPSLHMGGQDATDSFMVAAEAGAAAAYDQVRLRLGMREAGSMHASRPASSPDACA